MKRRTLGSRAQRGGLALLALLGFGLSGACTFYTGVPQPAANTGASTSAGSGASSSGGGDNTSGGDADSGAAGVTEDGGLGLPKWRNATGTLAGRSSAKGDVQFLSAKPDEDLLIASLSSFGLWGSRDGGKTWLGLGQSGVSDPITNIASWFQYDPDHPDVFWEAGIYNGGGVYRSDDDGKTIKLVGLHHNEVLGVDFTDPKRKTLVAGGHEQTQTLNRSTDGGLTWDSIGDKLPKAAGYSSYPLVLDAQTYLLGCNNMILRTTDSGETWSIVSNAGGFGPGLRATDGSIYWRVDGNVGLMRSTDDGKNWDRVLGGGILTSGLLELPDGRLASMNYNVVLVSADNGSSWKVVSSPLPDTRGVIEYSKQQKAFFSWLPSDAPEIPANSILRYDWDYETQ